MDFRIDKVSGSKFTRWTGGSGQTTYAAKHPAPTHPAPKCAIPHTCDIIHLSSLTAPEEGVTPMPIISRRSLLRGVALALGAPMINRGRFALFARGGTGYPVRAVDLVRRSTVIDMLGLLTRSEEH